MIITGHEIMKGIFFAANLIEQLNHACRISWHSYSNDTTLITIGILYGVAISAFLNHYGNCNKLLRSMKLTNVACFAHEKHD